MAILKVKNVKVVGISASVPSNVVMNSEMDLFVGDEYEKFVELTGVVKRRVTLPQQCSSDLCCVAAEKLIEALDWNRQEIDCLVFLSQTPDYIAPPTACILQDRLGLNNETIAFDISMGCSGWVYGMSIVSSMLSAGNIKKALLLVGDTCTKTKSPYDKGSLPLFGDAGSATALVYDENYLGSMVFDLYTDGSGAEAIMIKDGGFRNQFNEASLEYYKCTDGVMRNGTHSIMDGSTVFTFGISRPAKSIKKLLEVIDLKTQDIDKFVLHQANLMMIEKIRKKVGIPTDKVPCCIDEFGNTSGVSIPLTIVSRMSQEVSSTQVKVVCCGFGVGLSWGTMYLELDRIICCEIIEI